MGDGPRRNEFESYAREKGVAARFTGMMPYAEMCGLLSACDMVVNPIIAGSAATIINKHADYAASGLPVLNTQECPEYRDLVDEFHMGFNCVNGSGEDLADKLARLLEDPALRISEIAERVGYADTAHFSRVFKKLEGVSAGEWRNAHCGRQG